MIAWASDNTTVTLTWAFSLSLNNERVSVKVREELDKCVGVERLVNDADISNLVYLRATIKETLRLYPSAPLLSTPSILRGSHYRWLPCPKRHSAFSEQLENSKGFSYMAKSVGIQAERFLTTHKDVDVREFVNSCPPHQDPRLLEVQRMSLDGDFGNSILPNQARSSSNNVNA
ncbi:unnamed protein product [Dovyalis caffra]|uniref:Cytochrome P450 n=1 Tax=Dovyalis caffra TaxID=77055 RepID=A0AAV1RQP8_9ROSI|nr:unnamed protein product [Dovyalis caffra]